MTPPSDSGAAILRPAGEPCSGCGAVLAMDQRYCLECGARAGAPRLDPLLLARGVVPPAAALPPAAGAVAVRPAWDSLPPAARALGRPRVAAIAATGVLAVGALIGAGITPAPPSSASGPVYLAGTPRPAAAAPDDSTGAAAGPLEDGGESSSTPLEAVERVSPLPADSGGDDSAVTTPADSGGDDSATTPAGDEPALKAPAPVKHVWLISLEGVDLVAAAQAAATPSAAAAQAAPVAGGANVGSPGTELEFAL